MMVGALSVGERFSLGGITTLLGLGMTFVVLVLLIGCVYLISASNKLTDTLKKKLKAKKAAAVNENAVQSVATEKEDIDDATMAAIQSAVNIYCKETANDGKPHDNVTILNVKEV